MKNQDIFELMQRFEASGIARLRLTTGDTTLELEKQAAPVAVASSAAAPAVAPSSAVGSNQGAHVSTVSAPSAPAQEGLFITAPLVGTFYAASSPEAAPYVKVGDKVRAGETVCLLEAMKMMSEVTAPVDCVIEEVLVADGELVSFGDAIIRYREA